ncbi:MAG: hypothetical protein ACQEQG_10680 [Bacillota bacterium]
MIVRLIIKLFLIIFIFSLIFLPGRSLKAADVDLFQLAAGNRLEMLEADYETAVGDDYLENYLYDFNEKELADLLLE